MPSPYPKDRITALPLPMDHKDQILLNARAATVLINNGMPVVEDRNRTIDYVEAIISDYKRLYEENLALQIRIMHETNAS